MVMLTTLMTMLMLVMVITQMAVLWWELTPMMIAGNSKMMMALLMRTMVIVDTDRIDRFPDLLITKTCGGVLARRCHDPLEGSIRLIFGRRRERPLRK